MYTYMNMNILLIHREQAYKVCSHSSTRRVYIYSISIHGVYGLILTKHKTSTIPIFSARVIIKNPKV